MVEDNSLAQVDYIPAIDRPENVVSKVNKWRRLTVVLVQIFATSKATTCIYGGLGNLGRALGSAIQDLLPTP